MQSPVPEPVPETTPAAPISAENAAFPLRKGVGRRCLVDQTGRSFLLHGDAAWSLLVQLTRGEADRYLEDRRRRGFNTLLVNLIDHEFAARAPGNAYGEAPFVVPGDYARPNENYFAHVDWVLLRAAERGFLVLLTSSYLGYEGGNQGWYREMQDNGAERLRAYGRYLGLRYRDMTNIVWIHGGDYNPPERTRSMTHTRSLLDALGWWQLRPVHGFIVDGVGTGALRAVSAVSEDQRRAVVYIPSPRDIIVDTARLKGPRIKSRWIDPANARSVAVKRSSFDKSQRLKLRPPKHNNPGYGDWVLVLESKN